MGLESKSWASISGMSECGCVQSAGALSCHLELSFTCVKACRKMKVKFAGIAGKQVIFLDDYS